MSKRITLSAFIAFLTLGSCLYASNIANQRFIDNALQFDEEEGIRIRVESVDQKTIESSAGIEVVSSNSDIRAARRPVKKSVGPSFSDMASDVQDTKKSSFGTSFGALANAARGGKAKEKVAVSTTRNASALQRLFPTAPAPQKAAQPQKKRQWQSEEP